MVLPEQPHWPQPFLWPPVISVICCSTSDQYSVLNMRHLMPSIHLSFSLSLLRSAQTAESQCDRFLSEVVKSYRQMATIKFVSVSTSPQLSLALLLSAAPHSHILLGLTEHFIKMVCSYRHTGDPSDLVLFSILGGYPHHCSQIMCFWLFTIFYKNCKSSKLFCLQNRQ